MGVPVKRNIAACGESGGNKSFRPVFNTQGMPVGKKYPVPCYIRYVGGWI